MYALGGTLYSSGLPGREPVKLGLTVEQIYAGMVTAAATLGAYWGASESGVGQHVDLSLFEIMAGNQDRAAQQNLTYQYTGDAPKRSGPLGGRNICPTASIPRADGTCSSSRWCRPGTGLRDDRAPRPGEGPALHGARELQRQPRGQRGVRRHPARVAALAHQGRGHRPGAGSRLPVGATERHGRGVHGPASAGRATSSTRSSIRDRQPALSRRAVPHVLERLVLRPRASARRAHREVLRSWATPTTPSGARDKEGV